MKFVTDSIEPLLMAETCTINSSMHLAISVVHNDVTVEGWHYCSY